MFTCTTAISKTLHTAIKRSKEHVPKEHVSHQRTLKLNKSENMNVLILIPEGWQYSVPHVYLYIAFQK